jgi:hypothetical protein
MPIPWERTPADDGEVSACIGLDQVGWPPLLGKHLAQFAESPGLDLGRGLYNPAERLHRIVPVGCQNCTPAEFHGPVARG